MPIVNLSEAAAVIGISRQTLYNALRDGVLTSFDRGHGPRGTRLLELDGLRERLERNIRPRSDAAWRDAEPDEDWPEGWNEDQRQAWRDYNRRMEHLTTTAGLTFQDGKDLVGAVAGLIYAALDEIEAAADSSASMDSSE